MLYPNTGELSPDVTVVPATGVPGSRRCNIVSISAVAGEAAAPMLAHFNMASILVDAGRGGGACAVGSRHRNSTSRSVNFIEGPVMAATT